MGKIGLLILIGAHVFISIVIIGMLKPAEDVEGTGVFESVHLDGLSIVVDPDMFKQPYVIAEYDGIQFKEKLKPKKMGILPEKESSLDQSWLHFDNTGYHFGTETELSNSSSSSGSKSKEALIPLYERLTRVNIPEDKNN